jgi:hypothetical protein
MEIEAISSAEVLQPGEKRVVTAHYIHLFRPTEGRDGNSVWARNAMRDRKIVILETNPGEEILGCGGRVSVPAVLVRYWGNTYKADAEEVRVWSDLV